MEYREISQQNKSDTQISSWFTKHKGHQFQTAICLISNLNCFNRVFHRFGTNIPWTRQRDRNYPNNEEKKKVYKKYKWKKVVIMRKDRMRWKWIINWLQKEEEDARIRFIEEWMGNEKKKKILEYGLWKNEWETEEEEDTRIRFMEEWMRNKKKKKILEYGL